jgi:hypothetical protein
LFLWHNCHDSGKNHLIIEFNSLEDSTFLETWLANSLNLQEPKIRNQIESIRKKIRGIGDTGAWY